MSTWSRIGSRVGFCHRVPGRPEPPRGVRPAIGTPGAGLRAPPGSSRAFPAGLSRPLGDSRLDGAVRVAPGTAGATPVERDAGALSVTDRAVGADARAGARPGRAVVHRRIHISTGFPNGKTARSDAASRSRRPKVAVLQRVAVDGVRIIAPDARAARGPGAHPGIVRVNEALTPDVWTP